MSAEVIVSDPRECDIHRYARGVPGVPATVDGKTKSGTWAHMCDECHGKYGVGLGTGKGQRLIVVNA